MTELYQKIDKIIVQRLNDIKYRLDEMKANHEQMHPNQLKKIEDTHALAQRRRWEDNPLANEFYDETQPMYLRQQIDGLMQLTQQIVPTLQEEHYFSFTNEQLKQSQTSQIYEKQTQTSPSRVNSENPKLQDHEKDCIIHQLEVDLKTIRIQKIEQDQRHKQFLKEYDLVKKQNKQLQSQIDQLNGQIIALEKQLQIQKQGQQSNYEANRLDQSKSEVGKQSQSKSVSPLKKRAPPPVNEVGKNSQKFLIEKQAFLEQTLKQQSDLITDLQRQLKRVYNELAITKEVNSDLKNQVELSQKKVELSRSMNFRDSSPKLIQSQQIDDNSDKQINRLVIENSKLKLVSRTLTDKIASLMDELLEMGQFLLNLLKVMDRPDFAINIQHLRNVCVQQRELLGDRMILLLKERQQL